MDIVLISPVNNMLSPVSSDGSVLSQVTLYAVHLKILISITNLDYGKLSTNYTV